MKNIIINRTRDYGSRGVVLLNKEGRIKIEVIEPKSLRQIMDYVRSNFNNLEDATIDEENFSFKYGEYKVTFEFYRSYDFIREEINNLKNTRPDKISFLNRNDIIISFGNFTLKLNDYDAYIEVISLLNQIRNQKENIVYYIKGDKLYTEFNGTVIELTNYKKFSSDKKFKYIFDKIQKQKIKITKDVIIVGSLVLASSMGITSLITHVNAIEKTVYEKPKTKLEQSVPMPSHFEEESAKEETTYVDSELETLKIAEESKTTTQFQTKVESTTYIENDKYEELGIGSLANDEKLLTTKNLYFDIIEKYASKYGLDPELILAIATQERGIHSSEIDEGGAIGLMQVQVAVWLDKSLTVFDYDLNKEVTIQFTMDKLKSLEGNIEAGCAIAQHYQNIMNGNTFATIQSYNNGPYAVEDIFRKYKASSGKTTEQINLENDLGWYDYCTSAYDGDPEYLEHVLRYYQGDIRNLETKPDKIIN